MMRPFRYTAPLIVVSYSTTRDVLNRPRDKRLHLCRAPVPYRGAVQRRPDERSVQRMWPGRPRPVLAVKLGADKPRVPRQFHDLNQVLIGVDTRDAQPVGLQCIAVGVVDLVAMAVPFA